MKTDKDIKTTESKLSIEDLKAIERINICYKFRKNLDRSKTTFSF